MKLLDDPKFSAAVSAYTKEDDTHDVPFLGGSDNSGHVIYFDRAFVAAVMAGQVKYDGKAFNPIPFLKVHEAVEGAAIRLLHANYDTDNAQGLPGGHLVATWAERRAVAHAGLDWNKYQAALQPWIRKDEGEQVKNPPPNLLKVPYIGTAQAAEVGAQKLSHKSVDYSQGHANGDRCGICRHYQPGRPPHCELVQDPMNLGAIGWCNKFKKKGIVTVPHGHPILRSARKAKDGKFYVPDPNRAGKYLMIT